MGRRHRLAHVIVAVLALAVMGACREKSVPPSRSVSVKYVYPDSVAASPLDLRVSCEDAGPSVVFWITCNIAPSRTYATIEMDGFSAQIDPGHGARSSWRMVVPRSSLAEAHFVILQRADGGIFGADGWGLWLGDFAQDCAPAQARVDSLSVPTYIQFEPRASRVRASN